MALLLTKGVETLVFVKNPDKELVQNDDVLLFGLFQQLLFPFTFGLPAKHYLHSSFNVCSLFSPTLPPSTAPSPILREEREPD